VNDLNRACTYYGWCSTLPYRDIFFPTPAMIETMPVSELPVPKHIIEKLQHYLKCRCIGDVLDLSDHDALEMRGIAPTSFFKLREGLFQLTGQVVEYHEYFQDPDVQKYIRDLVAGQEKKIAMLDSRKWMASKYFKINPNEFRP